MAKSEILMLIRAAVLDDDDVIERHVQGKGSEGDSETAGRIAALFGLAVHRRFRPGVDVRDIAAFVSEVRSDLAEGDDIPPLEAEALIRASLGESELIERIPLDVILSTQIILTVRMLRDSKLHGAQLDKIFDDAEALAVRWGA